MIYSRLNTIPVKILEFSRKNSLNILKNSEYKAGVNTKGNKNNTQVINGCGIPEKYC